MYKQAKPNRELAFLNNLGVVKLTIYFENDVSEQFTASPLQAAIIALFNEPDMTKPQKSLSVDYIKDKLNITADRVR